MALALCLLLSASALKSYALTDGDYTYTVSSGKATITAFSKTYVGTLTIPAKLGGYPVAAIGNNSFKSCTNLTAITIPGTVTNVGEFAFGQCAKLASVNFPDGLNVLGLGSFYACSGLKSVAIPGSVTRIDKSAFGNSGLTNVTIRMGVKNIDNAVFEYCQLLTSASIPDSVTNIADLAFSHCYVLTDVNIGSNVQRIGAQAFSYCYGLKNVSIPSSATSLGYGAFQQCTNLTSVLFQGPAPTLSGSYVFSGTPATIYYLPAFASNWPVTFGGRPTLCWNPQVQRDADFGFANKRFGFNATGTANIPVAIEACTNLSAGIWKPLTNTTLGTAGSFLFTDPASTNLPARFYRIVWP